MNETSQIRLENISAQRREIEDLREQVDGGKPASPKLGGASDSQVNDLIKTVGLYFKVSITIFAVVCCSLYGCATKNSIVLTLSFC